MGERVERASGRGGAPRADGHDGVPGRWYKGHSAAGNIATSTGASDIYKHAGEWANTAFLRSCYKRQLGGKVSKEAWWGKNKGWPAGANTYVTKINWERHIQEQELSLMQPVHQMNSWG